MAEAFASAGDTAEQVPDVVELGRGIYGYCSSSDPNCGFVVGAESVLAIDARATPLLAEQMIADIRSVTEKPVKYLFMTHYHAVRALGASAFKADLVFASAETRDLVLERGRADMESEIRRFPRLFKGVSGIPGLTMPHATFDGELSFWFEERELVFKQLGRAHTRGDAVCHIPSAAVVFAGDLVENRCGVYTGDGYMQDWMETLERLRDLRAEAAVPGRGAPMRSRQAVSEAIDMTKDFISSLLNVVGRGVKEGRTLKECHQMAEEAMTPRFGDWPVYKHALVFDVSRAYDELRGLEHPQIWTEARDQDVWAQVQG